MPTHPYRKLLYACIALLAPCVFAQEITTQEDSKTESSSESEESSDDVANESPRERGRVLLKRNPIASEYQVFGDLGRSRGAFSDGEGVDFRGFFKNGYTIDGSESRRATLDLFYSDQSSIFKPGGSLSIREIFGDESDWAIELSVRTSASDRIFEHYQANWTELLELDDDGNRILDANFQGIPQTNSAGEEVFFLDRLRVSRDLIYTRNNSYKFRIEHAWNDIHRSYFEASITDYFSNNNRNRSEVRFPQSQSLPGFGDTPQGESTSINNGRYESASIRRYNGDTDTERFIQRYNFGGEVKDNDWTLNYSLYASEFENKVLRYDWNFFDRGLAGSYTIEDPYLPDFTLTKDGSPFDFTDISEAAFSRLAIFQPKTVDTDYGARLDFDTEIDFGSSESFISTGILYREKTRNFTTNIPVYNPNPATPFTLEDVQKSFDPGYIVEANYILNRGLSPYDSRRFVEENPDAFVLNELSTRLETARDLYDAFEAVAGIYLHSSLGFGQLRLETGARIEYTETETNGTNVGENNLIFEESRTNDYWNFLPTIEASYRASSQLRLVGSWYQILMRPQYFDIVPYERIAFPTRNISRGNPDLEPTVIDSFQIAAEYTSEAYGEFGIEFYYKQITDFFYNASSTEQFQGETFSTSSKGNGNEGTIYGLQFQYAKDLDFLQPALDSAEFSFAYTLSESEATVPTRPGDEILVPGRSRHNLSTSFNASKGPVSGGLSLTYQSYSLDNVGSSRGEDRFREETLALNANGRYKLNDTYSFTASLLNITDHPERSYKGDPLRVTNNQFGSWSARLGVTASF